MDWLKGKKTYIVSILMVVVTIINVISGELSWSEFFQGEAVMRLLEAFGLSFLRAGVSKGSVKS